MAGLVDKGIDWAFDNAGNIISAGVGAYAGSRGTKDAKTQTTPYLYPGQGEGITDYIDASRQQFGFGGPKYYPRQTVANLDPLTIQGQNARLGNVGAQNQLGNIMALGTGKLAQGGDKVGGFQLQNQIGFGLDPSLQNAVTNPIMRQLTDRVLPSLDLQATSQGAFGGSRAQQMKGQAGAEATERMTEALSRANLQARQQSIGQRAGDISAQISGRGQDINQNSMANQAMYQGISAIPSAQRALQAGAGTMGQVGSERGLYDQSLIGADVNRFNFNENRPYDNVDRLGNRVNFQTGGTNTNVNGVGGSPANMAGGALFFNQLYQGMNNPQGGVQPAAQPTGSLYDPNFNVPWQPNNSGAGWGY